MYGCSDLDVAAQPRQSCCAAKSRRPRSWRSTTCALGVSAGIRDVGLRVGEDVSVVGFDDIALADLAAPSLTTVRQPLAAMAAAALTHLRECIESDEYPTGRSLLMRPKLVVRSSKGPLTR
ncbi:substrate-binding domain-containing protein [Nonomuraea sp. NPDC026600]|uniref:substrate-binding domain-containing protein n=1 Tax=Nonomuraea sp. NPDC026600 TaxID=3155363 RepID=UPI0033CC47EB